MSNGEVAHFLRVGRPRRFPWGRFPKVSILCDETTVKRHAQYEAAKTGDAAAAKRLAATLTSEQALQSLRDLIGERTPILVPVHALEDQGINRIPAAFAELLGEKMHLEVEIGIVQGNVVNHTGASGWERMVRPPVFDGNVERGKEYLLVDDFVGQGGTLANLRGYLLAGGSAVLGGTTLTGRADSATLALELRTLTALKEKHGNEIENWWLQSFGYGFECLTESEARYLLRAENADTIRTRLVAAGSEEQH